MIESPNVTTKKGLAVGTGGPGARAVVPSKVMDAIDSSADFDSRRQFVSHITHLLTGIGRRRTLFIICILFSPRIAIPELDITAELQSHALQLGHSRGNSAGLRRSTVAES